LRIHHPLQSERVKILALLDEGRLDASTSLFKIIMQNNHATLCWNPHCHVTLSLGYGLELHLVAFYITNFQNILHCPNVVAVMVLGNVEDEHCFSTLSFMKSKLWNQLTTHLDLVVKMFAQDHYILDTFPFEDWVDNKIRYAINC
jgi:hypothetical protein